MITISLSAMRNHVILLIEISINKAKQKKKWYYSIHNDYVLQSQSSERCTVHNEKISSVN